MTPLERQNVSEPLEFRNFNDATPPPSKIIRRQVGCVANLAKTISVEVRCRGGLEQVPLAQAYGLRGSTIFGSSA
jgi:hypothetical protein